MKEAINVQQVDGEKPFLLDAHCSENNLDKQFLSQNHQSTYQSLILRVGCLHVSSLTEKEMRQRKLV